VTTRFLNCLAVMTVLAGIAAPIALSDPAPPQGSLGDSVGYASREGAENGVVGSQSFGAAVGYATREGDENGVIDSPDLSAAVGYASREAGENGVVGSPDLSAAVGHGSLEGPEASPATGQAPVTPSAAQSGSTSFDWADAGIGAAGALAVAMVIGGAFVLAHRGGRRKLTA